MIVRLTTTSKRENSTAIPSMSYSTQCRLKAPSSVMTPVLMFDRENLDHEYNYVYIADFNRYYWVTDVVYAGALIEYRCRIDVLASYKTAIGNSTQYVLRSSSRFNGDIVDNMYPARTVPEYALTQVQSPWVSSSLTNGEYCVGIFGQNSIKYYLFEETAYYVFFAYLLSDAFTQQVLTDLAITSPSLKLAVDPLQYIASVIWLPFKSGLSHQVQTNGIKIGFSTVPAAYCLCVDLNDYTFSNVYHQNSVVFQQQAHPYASARGAYLNSNAYTKVKVYLPPYGTIDLDATVVSGAGGNIIANYVTDMRTGDCVLTVSVLGIVDGSTTVVHDLAKITFNNAVTIPTSQIISQGFPDLLGIAGSVMSTALTANPLAMVGAGIGGTLSVISSSLEAMIPEVRQHGSTSSIVGYRYSPYIEYTWYIPVDDDNTQHGRPLCELVQINTLSGYILCAAGTEIQIRGTAAEEDQIRSYMEGGFFYE